MPSKLADRTDDARGDESFDLTGKALYKGYKNTYENAGHGFFSVDRSSYRQEAAVDGWKKVFEWLGRYLT